MRQTRAVVVGWCFASRHRSVGPSQTASGPHGVEVKRLNDALALLLAWSPHRP